MADWKMVGEPALIFMHMQHGVTHEAGVLGSGLNL